MFIFSCEGIVISVYPFSICCCPYLSFSQLTDACYFSFLGAAADIKNTDTSSSTLFLWIYAIMELLNHRVLNYPILQKKKKCSTVLILHYHQQVHKGSHFPSSSLILVIFCLFCNSHSERNKATSITFWFAFPRWLMIARIFHMHVV